SDQENKVSRRLAIIRATDRHPDGTRPLTTKRGLGAKPRAGSGNAGCALWSGLLRSFLLGARCRAGGSIELGAALSRGLAALPVLLLYLLGIERKDFAAP